MTTSWQASIIVGLCAFALNSRISAATIRNNTAVAPAEPTTNPIELGAVHWRRGFESATKLAKEQHKPLFVLFSEVPGCATCKGYGEQVMSHPLIVEAIETLFVPVAVYNNIEGDDRKTLESFSEPTWNNPVVRIVSADRTMLADRVDGNYTIGGVTNAIITALGKAKITIPTYLSLLNDEELWRRGKTEKVVFAVHCFWEGEVKFGSLEGVVATKAGFLNGEEVVEVEYAPSIVKFGKLRERVSLLHGATSIYARTPEQERSTASGPKDKLTVKKSSEPIKPDSAPKYYLSNTEYRHVPMTELQACRVNAALGRGAAGGDASRYLSPRQVELLNMVKAKPDAGWPNVVGTDIAAAWKSVDAIRAETSTPAAEKK